MTTEEFNNYNFSINTQIKIWDVDKFFKIYSVDFHKREIEFELGITDIYNIKEIKQK